MILYSLRCRKDHAFEGWFKDSATYDMQIAQGQIVCPTCGSNKVGKAIMAPRLGSGQRQAEAPTAPAPKPSEPLQVLRELRRQIESCCDYVGKEFPEEARKIHYGESDARGIYGETSDEEARALREEGVGIARIPWVPREDA